MTQIKVDGKLSVGANEALAAHAGSLFARLGSNRLAVVEIRSVERSEPAADEDKEQSVKVRVSQLEVATADQEDALRRCLEALHTHRTAYGTLTEDQDIELSDSVIEATGGELNAIEAARLKVAIDRWTEYLRRVLTQPKVTNTQLRSEVDTVIRGLRIAAGGTERLL